MNSLQRTTALCASLALASLTNLAPAHAQYTIDYLISPYKSGIADSWMFDINNQGQSTGYLTVKDANGKFSQDAVIYRNGEVQTVASTPGFKFAAVTYGRAINDQGDVVGSINRTPTYFSAATGTATTIDTPGMEYNQIYGINNAGSVLVNGWDSTVPQGYTENFQIWNNGTSRSLGALNALYPYTLAPDPNDPFSGISAFSSSFANTNLAKGDRFAAAVDYSTYDPKDLNNPDDDVVTDSSSAFVFDGVDNYHLLASPAAGGVIRPINTMDDGSVFGWVGKHLALWNPDGTLREMLPDYEGGIRLYGYGGYPSVQRNSLGQIVAITDARGIARYDPLTGTWSDVSSTIIGLGTGIFDSIQGFNDLGQFVGLVRPPSSGGGGTFGYVVTAVPEPGALALLLGVGVSGMGFVLRRRRK